MTLDTPCKILWCGQLMELPSAKFAQTNELIYQFGVVRFFEDFSRNRRNGGNTFQAFYPFSAPTFHSEHNVSFNNCHDYGKL